VRLLLFHLFYVGVTSNEFPAGLTSYPGASPTLVASANCRCVPDQWEGVLTTSEHEIDILDGRHREMRSSVLVHYDYRHQKLATDDLVRDRRSIADYSKVRSVMS
jgi:hypothetical protein